MTTKTISETKTVETSLADSKQGSSLVTEKCIICGKPTIPCIRYFTNEDGKIIQEYCKEHEEQMHRFISRSMKNKCTLSD